MLEAFATYLLAERRYSELTVRNYRHDIQRFVDYLGVSRDDFRPALVTADDIRGWIIYLSESLKLSPASVNREISSLRSFFRWLRATGVIDNNPFLKIHTLKTPKRLPVWIPETKMDGITDYLIRQSVSEDALERRNALVLLLFYSCGIRLAELTGICVEDISADFCSLKVHGKGDRQRMVPLPELMSGILRRYVDEITSPNIWKSGKKLLFLTDKGRPVSRSWVYRTVRDELEKMGVHGKRSPHVLRHTFATHLLDNGADMREIQELLGHASLASTQVYTHNSIARLKKAYEGAHPRGVISEQ